MDSISYVAKTVIAITLVWCIAENMLPDKRYKKYSSFIYGIVIISVFFSISVKSFDAENIFSFSNDNIDTSASKNLVEIYEDKLEMIMKDKFNDSTINIELTDDYKIKSIKCRDEKTYQKIMGYLNG